MIPTPPHRSIALGLFRSSVFFVIAVGAFSQRNAETQTILITLIFLLDVVSWHLCQVVLIAGNGVYNQGWLNTLADRIFFNRIFDAVRAGTGSQIDTEALQQSSTKEAASDIEKFLRDETVWFEWGRFKKTLFGAGHFLWYWTSYGIFYGIAAVLGNSMR